MMNQQIFTQQLPCHFYHSSTCNFNPCPYSHQGPPTGHCINDSCAICFKQYSQYVPSFTQQQQQQDSKQTSITQLSKRVHLPQELMNFMLPYRRPKQSSLPAPDQIQENNNNNNNNLANFLPPNFTFQMQSLVRQRSHSPQQEILSIQNNQQQQQQPQTQYQKELQERKVQSDNDQWQCINCGFEQNSLTIHACRKCEVPKINKRLDKLENLTEFDQQLDYLFVIDFECTCTEDNSLELMEIIEFPIVVIDTKKRVIVNTFSSYVKPTINEQLSEFCTNLTGITQKQVDKANPIEKVLKAADYFLQPYLQYNCAVLNDCMSDMKQFLLRESEYKNINLPDYFKKFINLKKIFPLPQQLNKSYIKRVKDLDSMLKVLDLEFVGRKHSGIADAKNISKVVIELLNRGFAFTTRLTESIYPYSQTIGNQNYKYMLLLSLQIKNKTNGCKIQEVGGVILNLHKNQVIWTNVFHHAINEKGNKSEKELYEFMIEDMKKCVINKTDLKKQDFLIATLGRKQMDILKYELARTKVEIPKFFNNTINLKKEIPELRKKKERKTCNTDYLIEEAMKILDILPSGHKAEIQQQQQRTSSLMDAMNLAQIVRKLVVKGHIFAEDSKF